MNDFNLEFKDKFIERYSKITDFEKFKEYSSKYLRRSIRVNTLKISVKELKSRLNEWNLKQIPWCKEGFWIDHKERRDVGNLIEHSLGYFYVQEAASMIPPIVLNPKKHSLVLDACSCPGSKTTQLASIMKNTGLIVANDDNYKRLSALNINLQRSGVLNTVTRVGKAEAIKENFDYILLDAPCSGTGTIRKSAKTVIMWNPDMIRRLSNIQKKMAENLFNRLNDKGTMVYSTCSNEPEENEGVIDFLLSKFDNAKIEKIELDIKRSSPIIEFEGKSYNKEIKKGLRIWPQDNDTEGFFICKIKKI